MKKNEAQIQLIDVLLYELDRPETVLIGDGKALTRGWLLEHKVYLLEHEEVYYLQKE